MEQGPKVVSPGPGEPLDGFDFVGGETDVHARFRPVSKDRLGHYFQPIFEIRQIVGIPESGEFFDRVGLHAAILS